MTEHCPIVLLVDESNNEPTSTIEFFVLGGLAIEVDKLWQLDREILRIRSESGFEPGDLLKFQKQSRPEQVDVESWNAAKGQVLDAASDVGSLLFVCLIHHKIATDREKRVRWQFDHVVRAFHQILVTLKRPGIVIADRLTGYVNEHELMRDRFGQGLRWESGYQENLDRIMLYASSSAGASHVASATDIAIGTFAYCVNERRPGWDTPKTLMRRLTPLLLTRAEGGRLNPLGRSIILRPQTPLFYARQYEALLTHLESLDDRLSIPYKAPPYL